MINFLKNKYYWYRNFNRLSGFFKRINNRKILIYGYPKSGNTWLRFLVYNYHSLLLDFSRNNTLTYKELNSLQNNVMDRGDTNLPINDFPFIYRTHAIHNKSYSLFDYKIYIHRNPLDTLISSYYFYRNRKVPFPDYPRYLLPKLHDIDFYVKYNIESWIRYYRISIKNADHVINYSDLREDTHVVFTDMVNSLGWRFDKRCIDKAIKLSSFQSIQNMGRNNLQKEGNSPRDGSFIGEFARSGIEGQFQKELKIETIDEILKEFPDFIQLYKLIS